MSTSPISGQHDKMTAKETQSKFIHDAPPLLPRRTSKYHINWKRLADLPAPLRGACITVHGGKVYVTGGINPVEGAQLEVFVYEIYNDRWGQLRTPDHYLAIPHIIDGSLTLIGGRLIATKKITNKVSTFDQTKQSWISYYPNLLSARHKPGVVTHMEYVIVAGGGKGEDTPILLDDIEILDWLENTQWKRVSVHLPVPMFVPQLTVCNDTVFVVGYFDARFELTKLVYELPVAVITNSADQECASTRWIELGETTHWDSSVVTGLSSLTVAGGYDATYTVTQDIKTYDRSTQQWKKIDSLSFARCSVAATAIYNNTIIIIGGCTNAGDPESSGSYAVEQRQVEQVAVEF